MLAYQRTTSSLSRNFRTFHRGKKTDMTSTVGSIVDGTRQMGADVAQWTADKLNPNPDSAESKAKQAGQAVGDKIGEGKEKLGEGKEEGKSMTEKAGDKMKEGQQAASDTTAAAAEKMDPNKK